MVRTRADITADELAHRTTFTALAIIPPIIFDSRIALIVFSIVTAVLHVEVVRPAVETVFESRGKAPHRKVEL